MFNNLCGASTPETAWKWYTWARHDTAIFCDNCFRMSNHHGHNYTMVKVGGGSFWDCGDSKLWRPSGFWDFHSSMKEFTKEEVEYYLTPEVSKRTNILFNAFGGFMHQQFLIRDTDPKQKESIRKIIGLWIGIMSYCLETSPIFNYFITSMLARIHPYIGRTNHECPKIFYTIN